MKTLDISSITTSNSGVYAIEHIQSKRIYVGSSKNIKARLYKHKRCLESGTHSNKILQNYFNKLCTYCVTYKSSSEFLKTNLSRKFYKCSQCEYQYRKDRLGNINRLIDNIYGHQKEKVGQLAYTIDELSEWLATTNFFELHRTWVVYKFDKAYTPTVLRIDPKKPYALDNLRATTATLARLTCSHLRDRKVIQMNDEGNELAIFNNARVAAQFLNYKYYSNIHEACKGSKRKAAGYRWRYA